MQDFLERVNDRWFVFFLGQEILENLADFLVINTGDWNMDEGGENSIGMNTQYAFEWRFFIDMKGVEVFESIECFTAEDALVGNSKFEFTWIASEEEVANHTKEREGDRHEWAIGKDGVGNDEGEENGRDHEAARIGPDMDVFRSAPNDEWGAGKRWSIHKEVTVISFFSLYHKM